MTYKILIERPAQKFILKQPRSQQERILRALAKLPAEGDIVPMRGTKGQYRVRIGTYRAVYHLHNDILTVQVLKVDNRGGVYKG